MKKNALKRLVALMLAAVMVAGLGVTGVSAKEQTTGGLQYEKLDPKDVNVQLANTENPIEETEIAPYADDEMVRVTIVMEDAPAAVQAAGTTDLEAVRTQLVKNQQKVEKAISKQVLDGQELDTVWNLTLATNAISANVEYGKIKEIAKVSGVAAVILETRYEPLETADPTNIVAQTMTGASTVQAAGYTGAGTRIAVIDTGVDTDHQSFAEDSYLYALEQLDGEYDLLDKEEIEALLPQLHAAERYEGLTAEDVYISAKIPFGYNYIDNNLDVTHDNDDQGSHGSHVAGIAAANRYVSAARVFEGDNVYDFDGDRDFDVDDVQTLMEHIIQGKDIPNANRADLDGDGLVTDYDAHLLLDLLGSDYVDAASQVGVSGVAADAQIFAMKVFGQGGGAYDSDYMAAVEDAVLLGCDTINMSLGASYPGFSHSFTYYWYDEAIEALANTGVVLCVSAGNSYAWAYNDDAYGLMYADEVEMGSVTNPAGYANAMAVASAENVGSVTDIETSFSGNGDKLSVTFSSETVSSGNNASWSTMDPEVEGADYEAVFLGDPSALLEGDTQTDERIYAGSVADFGEYDYSGKVVLVARGNMVNFADKHTNAELAGAAAVVIYNNEPGLVYANLSGSEATIPCGMLSYEQAQQIFAMSRENEDGLYSVTFHVACGLTVDWGEGNAVTMSDFSSWGAIGDLSIKPDITAPGGGIYSVNGVDKSGSAYETMSGTSMAAPHAAGIAALVIQYIRENELADSDAKVRQLAQSLMMSTATPVIEQESGLEYSVRKQGSGLANVPAIVAAQSYIFVDGQEDGKVKAELGDGTADRSFTFTIYNRAENETVFDLSASMLTPNTVVADGNALTDTVMTKLNADVTFSTGDTVTVPANGSAEVTVTISVPEEEAQKLYDLGHTNGFYVEGYIYAAAQADAEGKQDVTHSIPLLAWYGNWSDPTMFDEGSYIEKYYDTQERPSHIVNAVDGDGYTADPNQKNMLSWTIAGYGYGFAYSGNVYNGGVTADGTSGGDSHYDEARNAINVTSDRYWEFFGFFPTLTRNAIDADLFITDEEGNVLYRDDEEGYAMYSNFYYSSYGTWFDFTTASGFTIEDWSFAEELEEGTRLNITLGVVPEYYISDEDYFSNFAYDDYYEDVLFAGYEIDDEWWTDGTIGEGCFLRTTFVVDNTAPDLTEAPTLVNNQLSFTVQDNEYVAAVILLDGSNSAVEYYYPDMPTDARGQAVSGSFDVSEMIEAGEKRAVLTLCDYAGNETYYAVNLTGEQGSSYSDLVAFQYGDGWYNDYAAWVAFDTDVNQNEMTLYNEDLIEMVAAEYVNGYIFAQDSNGKLYGIDYQKFLSGAITDLESTYITTLERVYQDIAYNYTDGNLYGLYNYEDGGYPYSYIYAINMNGEYYDSDLWEMVEPYQEVYKTYRGALYGLAMAIDDDGTFYIMGPNYDAWDTEELEETASLWTIQHIYEEYTSSWGSYGYWTWKGTEIGDTGLPMNYLQSMTWNHNDETLYWAQFSNPNEDISLYQVNPETAECTKTGTLRTETCAMFAPLTAETAAKEEHSNVPAFDSSEIGTPILSADSLTMGKNTVQTLSVNFEPWYTGHKNVVWSSDDESVATVNQKGKVTAIGEGKCVITVANAEDESKFDTCEITVAAISANIEGIVSYAPSNIMSFGDSRHYDFTVDAGVADMELGEGLTFSQELADAFKAEYGEDADIADSYSLGISAATLGRDGYLWVSEGMSNGMFYKVDPETMEVVEILEPIGGDFTYSIKYNEKNDTFSTVSNYWMFTNLDMDEEMYDKLHEMVNNHEDYTTYHRVDLSGLLAYSDTGFDTGEHTGDNYDLDIVVSAMEIIHEEYTQPWEYNYKDFMGNWDYNVSGANYAGIQYTTDTTYVLLDNVGRLWYLDEIPNFKVYKMEYEDYDWRTGETVTVVSKYYYNAETVEDAMSGEGMLFSADSLPNGMIFMEDVDADGNEIATCYYVRELKETPLTDMYRVGTMPRITYHYSDLYYAGTIEGAPMFFMSLYDFHNDGKTNQFYLYVDGMGTGEWGYDDDWNYVELTTDPVIYELGNSGEYRVIALMTKAEYLGGLPGTDADEGENANAVKTFVTHFNFRAEDK